MRTTNEVVSTNESGTARAERNERSRRGGAHSKDKLLTSPPGGQARAGRGRRTGCVQPSCVSRGVEERRYFSAARRQDERKRWRKFELEKIENRCDVIQLTIRESRRTQGWQTTRTWTRTAEPVARATSSTAPDPCSVAEIRGELGGSLQGGVVGGMTSAVAAFPSFVKKAMSASRESTKKICCGGRSSSLYDNL